MGRVGRRASVVFVVVVGSLAVPLLTSRPAVLAAGSGKTAFVTNFGSDTVTPIDVATKTAGAPIPVGSAPRGVAITPDGKTALITNPVSNNVTPIDVATKTAGTPITVGSNPVGVAITPDGRHRPRRQHK
jgi:YVTN family beta-propeller protein